ncbi:MAG: FAD-dependent oxidoreductase [Lentisphaerae bacterium]|nr:FAD-dependent oxidoreductase [Lentisphaerota bacterium]
MQTARVNHLAECDILIIGSGLAALKLALQKSAGNAKVFLAGSAPFPAWELTGRWEFDPALMQEFDFLSSLPCHGKYPYPAAVKHAVFQALEQAGIMSAGQLYPVCRSRQGMIFGGCGKFQEITAGEILEVPLDAAGFQVRSLCWSQGAERADFVWQNRALSIKDNYCGDDIIAGTFPDGEKKRHCQNVQLPEDISIASEGSRLRPVRNLAVDQEVYDCIVVGGGTAGAAAAIAAAREGGRVLLLERFYAPGGLATMGRITNHFYGNRVGFAAELDHRAAACSGGTYSAFDGSWKVEAKKSALLEMLAEANIKVKFNSEVCAVLKRQKSLCGVISVSFDGATAYYGKVIIDSSGNADVAAAAGAACGFINDEPALQGTGVPALEPGCENSNSDFTFTSNQNILDITRTLRTASELFKEKFDFGPMIDTRERRRIKAVHTITPADAYAQREYFDCIVRCYSRFDTHGFMTDRIFDLNAPSETAEYVEIPYRALLPEKVDDLLVTGLGTGADRDAMPFLRMQPDVLNQGYAAGVAAMLAVHRHTLPRNIPIRVLQKKLIRKEILPRGYDRHESLIPSIEPLPLDAQNMHRFVGAILLQKRKYLRQIQRYFLGGKDLRYAQLLAMMGDDTGAGLLAEEVRTYPFSKDIPGWNFTGMGQSGRCASRIDTIIHSLARLNKPFAADGVLNRLSEISCGSALSHFRSVGYYLMRHPDFRTGDTLLQLLKELLKNPVRYSNDPLDTAYRNWRLKCFYMAGALYKLDRQNQLAKDFLNGCIAANEGALTECAKKIVNFNITTEHRSKEDITERPVR